MEGRNRQNVAETQSANIQISVCLAWWKNVHKISYNIYNNINKLRVSLFFDFQQCSAYQLTVQYKSSGRQSRKLLFETNSSAASVVVLVLIHSKSEYTACATDFTEVFTLQMV